MILSLFLSSLNVSNYHIADSIMQKLCILNECNNRKYLYYLPDDMKPVYVNSCMFQEIGLTCPFPRCSCVDCHFNPIFWQVGLNKDLTNSLDFLKPLLFRAHNFER